MSVQNAVRGGRILLVEDDPELRGSLIELLRDEGYDAVGVSNGMEALRHLKQDQPADLILLDLMMPVMDGWQFRVEQKRDPQLAAIPVLAISADNSAQAAAIDADNYLKKPFEYDSLIQNIERILHTQRLAHADRLASLGTLAAGIAHEINNPLSYVMANLRFLGDELPRLLKDCRITVEGVEDKSTRDVPPPAEVSRRLKEIEGALDEAFEGTDRIRRIVSDIKSVSTADDARRQSLDPRKVLDSALNIVMNEIRHRARLVRTYGPVPNVLANEGRLGQVFVNLLINAAQSIQDGDANNNEVKVTSRTDSTGRAVIEIADSGAGIAPEIQGRIFEPFFTTKPVGVGTGLGLSICHGIVTALGGELSFESEPGRGSTFVVKLPAAPESTKSEGARSEPSLPATPSRGRILLIDDEPALLRAFKRMLEPEHDVTAVTSGREAMKLLLLDDRFDVILCDLMMPEMSGMELYDRLRKILPGVEKKMVFMTGCAFTQRARDFVESVGNMSLPKPFDREGVRGVVSRVLSKKVANA